MKKVIFITFLFGVFAGVQAHSQHANKALEKADRRFFIENKGQWHPDVLYLCRMGGLDAWITRYGVNYTLSTSLKKTPTPPPKTENKPMPRGKFDREEQENTILLGHRVLMKLQNANANPSREGKQKQQGYYNYFIGNDPDKHATYVGLYKEAVVKDVYNGIDLRYYFDKGNLRYDFVVHPGADPSQIVFKLEGQYETNVKGNQLLFTTRFGEVAMADLKTYQAGDKKQVASQFRQIGQGEYSISVAHYDPTQTLIIDPLIYSTYIGGSNNDYVRSIAVDGSGNAYVTGSTQSTDYDITAGAFQTTNVGGFYDVFVTKLNATGTGLVYSTYIGGSSDDYGYAIAIDGSGNAYVTGYTRSLNYDITPGAFQTTYSGGASYDVFVTKLNATGTGLVYSTYIGGTNTDYGFAIAVDDSGNAYVTGQTVSTDYDITPGAFQTTYNSGGNPIADDVFVTKLNPTGTGLVYSTYLGGSDEEFGSGIAIDGSGNAYVTGGTYSTDYPTTPGAFQTTLGGEVDVFITKLNPTGTGLVYSTYIGGSNSDQCSGIAIDGSGNAYVTGRIDSTDYDITPGAFQTTHGGGAYDAFVTKLNATGTALVYSTYIGGSDIDQGNGIAIDGSGNAYVTGYTRSLNYAITPGAFQTTLAFLEYTDVFVTKLNATGTGLIYSTYLGGSYDERGSGIDVDGSGNAYVTGYTLSPDYDITPRAFRTNYYGGLYDVFVTKLDMSGTTGLSQNASTQSAFHIYPNPNNGQFVIRTKQGGVFDLVDITGKVMDTYTLQNTSLQIHEHLPAGMYFIIEKTGGSVQKLIIQ
ncbi:MAG: hypothetical protein KatS3mg031_2486 [Chitinophagales bacterium]|nr:MAG: hypothetical protein KatS3mg031_2486 [Chitinophagales bacterium]